MPAPQILRVAALLLLAPIECRRILQQADLAKKMSESQLSTPGHRAGKGSSPSSNGCYDVCGCPAEPLRYPTLCSKKRAADISIASVCSQHGLVWCGNLPAEGSSNQSLVLASANGDNWLSSIGVKFEDLFNEDAWVSKPKDSFLQHQINAWKASFKGAGTYIAKWKNSERLDKKDKLDIAMTILGDVSLIVLEDPALAVLVGFAANVLKGLIKKEDAGPSVEQKIFQEIMKVVPNMIESRFLVAKVDSAWDSYEANLKVFTGYIGDMAADSCDVRIPKAIAALHTIGLMSVVSCGKCIDNARSQDCKDFQIAGGALPCSLTALLSTTAHIFYIETMLKCSPSTKNTTKAPSAGRGGKGASVSEGSDWLDTSTGKNAMKNMLADVKQFTKLLDGFDKTYSAARATYLTPPEQACSCDRQNFPYAGGAVSLCNNMCWSNAGFDKYQGESLGSYMIASCDCSKVKYPKDCELMYKDRFTKACASPWIAQKDTCKYSGAAGTTDPFFFWSWKSPDEKGRCRCADKLGVSDKSCSKTKSGWQNCTSVSKKNKDGIPWVETIYQCSDQYAQGIANNIEILSALVSAYRTGVAEIL